MFRTDNHKVSKPMFADIEAAHSAGIASIGYANQPGKRENMTQAQAEAVITSMADLALSLRARRPPE